VFFLNTLKIYTGIPPVSVSINNNPSQSWFWGFVDSIKGLASAHPYIMYVMLGATAGVLVYYCGGYTLISTTTGTVFSQPRSTARAVVVNSNSQTINELQTNLLTVQQEVRRMHVNTLVALSQQGTATERLFRETTEQIIAIQQAQLATHDVFVQLIGLLSTL
jgi:hypothetical protein